jgi:serine/threonine-protein phosphatase 2A regulatory subunit A
MVKLFPLVTEGIVTATIASFMKDDQDFVRMYVVDSVIALSKT